VILLEIANRSVAKRSLKDDAPVYCSPATCFEILKANGEVKASRHALSGCDVICWDPHVAVRAMFREADHFQFQSALLLNAKVNSRRASSRFDSGGEG